MSGRIMPGALGHRADAHLAAAQRARSRCSSWPRRRSCGSRRRRPRRRSRTARPRPARCPARSASIGSGLPITPVEQTTTSSAAMPSAARSPPPSRARRRMPWAPVQAFALPELTTTARARPSARCSRESTTGAAARRLRVNAPAAAAAPSQATSARSGAPDSLMPQVTPAARKPRGKQTPTPSRAHTPSPCAVSPAPSSRPSTRFAFCSACPAAPLTRLSIAAAQIAVCVRSSTQTPRWQLLAPCRRPGVHALLDRDERLGVVARVVQRLGLGLGERPAQPGVARDLEAARVRREVRRERDRHGLAGEARRASARSRRCGGARSGCTAARRRRPRSGACFSVGSRPAPETPDLPSIATGASSRPASASGASARIAAVA